MNQTHSVEKMLDAFRIWILRRPPVLGVRGTARRRSTLPTSMIVRGWCVFGVLIACVAAGCGKSDEDGDDDKSSSRALEALEDLRVSIGSVCARLASCYPELSDSCSGPGDGDPPANRIVFGPLEPLSDEQAACIRGLASQDAVAAYYDCLSREFDEQDGCLSTCPTSVQACADAGNAMLNDCSVTHDATLRSLMTCAE